MKHFAKLLAVGALATALSGPAAAQTITFTALPQGPLTHFMVTVVSKMLLEKTDLKVRVAPMRGTAAQVAAIERGRAELMTIDVTQAAAALQGKEAWEGRPAKKIRAVAKLVSFPGGFIVKKNSPIRRIRDLKGKRLPGGFKAFPQGITLITAMLKTDGLTYGDVRQVLAPGLIRSWEDFKAGKTDSTNIAPTAPKTKEIDAALGGIRFLAIPNNAQTVAAIKSVRKDFYLQKYKPLPHMTGVVEPMHLLTFDMAIAAGTHVSDEVVAKVAKALHDNKATLAKGHAVLRGFFPARMGKKFAVLQYHKAAANFLKQKGLQ